MLEQLFSPMQQVKKAISAGSPTEYGEIKNLILIFKEDKKINVQMNYENKTLLKENAEIQPYLVNMVKKSLPAAQKIILNFETNEITEI
jgi:hypothetical protein